MHQATHNGISAHLCRTTAGISRRNELWSQQLYADVWSQGQRNLPPAASSYSCCVCVCVCEISAGIEVYNDHPRWHTHTHAHTDPVINWTRRLWWPQLISSLRHATFHHSPALYICITQIHRTVFIIWMVPVGRCQQCNLSVKSHGHHASLVCDYRCSASEITYIVSGGALNSILTHFFGFLGCACDRRLRFPQTWRCSRFNSNEFRATFFGNDIHIAVLQQIMRAIFGQRFLSILG